MYPHHLTRRDRINFPTWGEIDERYRRIRAVGDGHGHLVAAQFSGPPEWYNLSPQNIRVNRNRGYQSITTEWYKIECEVREFLERDGNRYVKWSDYMTFPKDSNRPNEYHLRVRCIENGQQRKETDTSIRNPFLHEDGTFYNCGICRDNKCCCSLA